jgi:hypothetical protein
MSVNPITFISQVTSDAGATVNWVAANNVAAAAITAVGAGYHELREQPQWVRLQTAAGGVAIYAATFVVRRLDS